MKLIGENLHIISGIVKDAIIKHDDAFILNLVKKQMANGIDTIDLNIGPAKGSVEGAMSWLTELIQKNFPELNYSLDTTSVKELKNGFQILNNRSNSFLNSASADETRLKSTADISKEYDTNLIALTMNSRSGIPKTSDERLELAFEISDVTNEIGIDNSKIYFDPLILPISVNQKQSLVALETIRMLKESFDPEVKTVIGLSNISNGSAREIRPLINRVFMVLALGYGLDCAIIDAFDKGLIELVFGIENNLKNTPVNQLYLDLFEMAQTFGDLRDIKYDKQNKEQKNIYKTAQILLNKELYSNSYTEN